MRSKLKRDSDSINLTRAVLLLTLKRKWQINRKKKGKQEVNNETKRIP